MDDFTLAVTYEIASTKFLQMTAIKNAGKFFGELNFNKIKFFLRKCTHKVLPIENLLNSRRMMFKIGAPFAATTPKASNIPLGIALHETMVERMVV